MLPLKHLANAIRRGDYDHRLDEIPTTLFRICQERMDLVSEDKIKDFRLGDTVRVTGKNIRPKYMIGKIGKVDEFDGDYVWFVLDPPVRRGMKTYRRFCVKAYHLEKLNVS